MSQSFAASSMLWVVRKIAIPSSFSSSSIRWMATAVEGSRPLVGSSRNKTLGLCSTARARTSRWVWPLESFPAGLFLCSPSPT